MSTLVPSPYDKIAFHITNFLATKDTSEEELHDNLISTYSISSETIGELLNQMSNLDLILLNQDNLWVLTTTCISLFENSDQRINTLISSFQFSNIPFVSSIEDTTNGKLENSAKDPIELLKNETETKIKEYNIALRRRLKEILFTMNEYRLEEVVIELLVKSGEGKYGVSTSKSNDGGIDGYIYESYLKRGAMLVQTKRYAENIYVNKGEIHEFLSVCSSNGAKSGYFVTTSYFSDSAISIARLDLCLVDGDQLVDLILRTTVGLLTREGYLVSIDEEYFFRPPLPSGKHFEIQI